MHVWKLAVLRVALQGWSYTDCCRKKLKKQEKRGEDCEQGRRGGV